MTEVQEQHSKQDREPRWGWQPEAFREREGLREQLEDLKNALLPDDYALLSRELDDVPIRSGEVDRVWQELHRLEEEIARRATGHVLLEFAISLVEHSKDPLLRNNKAFSDNSAAWKRVKAAVDNSTLPDSAAQPGFAGDIATLLHHAHVVGDGRHVEANLARRRLVAAAVGAATLSLLIAIASLVLTDVPFLVNQTSFGGVPAWQLTALVVLGGLVGGSWGALPAFTSTGRDRYRLQYARAALRLCIGVLAALVGVSLVGAGWVTALTAGSASALFAVAIAFGLTQEPITKVLEGKVQGAVQADKDRSKPDAK